MNLACEHHMNIFIIARKDRALFSNMYASISKKI